MLLILQEPWSPVELDKLDSLLGVTLELTGSEPGTLVLLPRAEGDPREAPAATETLEGLAEVAERRNIFLAGASVLDGGTDQAATLGFLLDPTGNLLLRTAKVLPDLTSRFSDTTAATFAPGEFPTAPTSAGRVGVLCGEDVLSPHLVRALVVNGAELILNPACELRDELTDMRQQARAARAYENLALVATASPRQLTCRGTTVQLPAASQLADNWGHVIRAGAGESFLAVDPDIQALRRRRQETRANFPAIVRMNLYARSLAEHAGALKAAPRTRAGWQELGAARLAEQTPPPRADTELCYEVALCQHVVHQSSKPEQLKPNRQRNLDDALELAQRVARAPSMRLIVLPEFFLTGPVSPLGNRLGHLATDIGVQLDGPEIAQVADFAKAHRVFMAGGVFEYDPQWPNRFFNTAFILDDRGELILRYRKIHCGDVMGFLPDTTPGSVFSAFVERYGYESLYPVVDTVLGRLAATICFDMNFPETYRELARRGAEVILHPTSEPHNRGRRGWDIGRHVRAFENTAYVLSAGHGGEWVGDNAPESTRARGYSKIVNFDGSLQAVVDTAGRAPLAGNIDLAALRRARAQTHHNLLLWDDPVVYAQQYGATPRGIPNDVWTDDPFDNPYADGRQIRAVVDAYGQAGIFTPPAPLERG